ncbi:hypothetical protein OOT55_14325 [Marinimicrobium sp. C6131]|uniref:hypothetical protein n=1 Tax=Marinimicrobium sp. C6131 TaxID=3022676 RepID=UPI00223D43DD|nr:hypothetical protein [Marinimicrobium sp. C6131]UZJ43824.1 hypothetical protein OOT55_14325 [Marinimicrobium sp. C6131]
MSDSADYRTWVYIQMALLLLAAAAAWQVLKLNVYGLVLLGALWVSITYINSTYLNYGNGPLIWIVPLAALLLYVGSFCYTKYHLRNDPGNDHA